MAEALGHLLSLSRKIPTDLANLDHTDYLLVPDDKVVLTSTIGVIYTAWTRPNFRSGTPDTTHLGVIR